MGRITRDFVDVLSKFNLDGLVRLIQKRKVTILVYHSPEKKIFDRHLEYISSRYSVIPFSTLRQAIINDGFDDLPDRALCITIDDGHRSNHELVTVCHKHNVTPLIYLCTQVIREGRLFWWSYYHKKESERLKRVPNKERLKSLSNLRDSDAVKPSPALTIESVEKLKGSFEYGGHTRSHPIVTTLADEELDGELAKSRHDLEDVGIDLFDFAYPNGDFSQREKDVLRRAGYVTARTTDVGWVDSNSDPYALKAMGISDDASISKLRLQLCGLWGWLVHLKSGGSLSGRKRIIKI